MITLRESGVLFNKASHRYHLDGKVLQGITSTLVRRAYPDTYKDIPEEKLMRAASRGTAIHQAIEDYEEQSILSDKAELMSYVRIKESNGLEHVASEYLVTDGERYASAIDHVFVDAEGNIILADIKTTSEKHYENVACQLSIYKRFFEQQNPSLKVTKIVLIWLRGEKEEYRELQPWEDEWLDALFLADAEDKPFDINITYGDLPDKVAAAEDEIVRIESTISELTEKSKAIKADMYKLLERYNKPSYTGARVRLTKVLPTEKESFDTAKFKAEHPDMYAQYLKKTTTSGSLRITIL